MGETTVQTLPRPMLAANFLECQPRWPLMASPKIDGIRCIILNGLPISRSGKALRNNHLQTEIAKHAAVLESLDGELVVGSPCVHDTYRRTNSEIMTIKNSPEFTFYVFDSVTEENIPYADRFNRIKSLDLPPFVKLVEQVLVNDHTELYEYEGRKLDEGYEGVIVRDPFSLYKFGRSTSGEATLMKLKRFTDDEALCIGFGELMHNENEAVTNSLGYTERSSSKSGLVGGNTLGYLVARSKQGVEFKIGTGFNQEERQSLWLIRDTLPGKVVKFKSFNVGVKSAPRHPVWLGFRDYDDLEHNVFNTTGVETADPQTLSWFRTLDLINSTKVNNDENLS